MKRKKVLACEDEVHDDVLFKWKTEWTTEFCLVGHFEIGIRMELFLRAA